ncbi:hypothetical protein K432DRAFT_269728, partial [Lepidopterella palustris CBS 459.81]
WITNRRGLAVGLATLGSGIGGIVFPIMIYDLVAQVGFALITRILGFIFLITLTIAGL